MGACCSCHRGGPVRGYQVEEERRFDDGNVVLRGDAGARIRLQGWSKNVSMFTQQGKKGINQDSITVWERFAGDKDMYFCSVHDGHGPSGHKVSRYVRDLLPAKISHLYRQASIDGTHSVMDVETATDVSPDSRNPFFLSWKARLTKAFHDVDEQLEMDGSVESYCSGSTTVSVLKKGEHLIISNLGDSRAVLCTRDDCDQLVAEQLTVDLKPNVPSEAKRIVSCQGRIQAMENEPNVYRIWMPHEDCPGLAMARAFGDFCLKDFGLISTPVVTYRKLTERDEFVVLATDGVWDALSNDVVKIIASASDRSTAAQSLVENAWRAWRYEYPRSKIDDCAAVCLFFKRHSPVLSPAEVSQYSLSYSDLDTQSWTGSSENSVDALDTVLDCKPSEVVNVEKAPRRPRKKRLGRKLETVEE